MKIQKLVIGIFSLMVLPLSSVSFAGNQSGVDHQGVYVGAGYGLLKAKGSDEFDDDNDAGKIYIGAQFNQFIAIEGSYIDFGEYGGNVAKADVDGNTLALKLSLPLGNHASLYGVGGQLWWDADVSVLNAKGDTDGEELFYGVGAAFALTKNLDLRLEYTRFNIEFEREEVGVFADIDDTDTDLDFASASLQYTF